VEAEALRQSKPKPPDPCGWGDRLVSAPRGQSLRPGLTFRRTLDLARGCAPWLRDFRASITVNGLSSRRRCCSGIFRVGHRLLGWDGKARRRRDQRGDEPDLGARASEPERDQPRPRAGSRPGNWVDRRNADTQKQLGERGTKAGSGGYLWPYQAGCLARSRSCSSSEGDKGCVDVLSNGRLITGLITTGDRKSPPCSSTERGT
jgi:hypothetical protein